MNSIGFSPDILMIPHSCFSFSMCKTDEPWNSQDDEQTTSTTDAEPNPSRQWFFQLD